jgi:hypothetical protein
MVTVSLSSQTTSHLLTSWRWYPTRGLHASPGSYPTWQNIPQIFATSPGQPTWCTVHSGFVDRGMEEPAETASSPLCRPNPGGLQGSQNLHHPGRQAEGNKLRGPPEGPHLLKPGVSSRGHFSRLSSQAAGCSFDPACTFMKLQTGKGGACRGSCRSLFKHIFRMCVLLNVAPARQ